MNLLRKELPMLMDNKINGIALVEIINIKQSLIGTNLLRVEALASTKNEINKKIQFNIFFNSSKFNVDNLKKIAKVSSNEELIGKLFYMKLSVNSKGYQDVTEVFFRVDENELVYDPRKLRSYSTELEDLF